MRIQYDAKINQVESIAKYLSRPGMSGSDVGRHTFHYFLQNEVGEKSEMAVQSTAKFVSYDLRPSKQIERKMMLDSFGAAMEAGFSISEYRYVGMGGNRFYDFMLIHKFLGIEKMISLEHDRKMIPRANIQFAVSFHTVEKRRT